MLILNTMMRKLQLTLLCFCALSLAGGLFAQVTISGTVYRADNAPIGNVPVVLSGSADEIVYTDENGQYAFTVPTGSYSVSVTSNANHQDGVTTLDAVLIQKHILGEQLLDSPYKLLAADVNQSAVINETDIDEVSNVIYGVTLEFPNNNAWRFYPASYQFPDPSNPWLEAIPEVINLSDLSSDQTIDFVGVKTGDVNLSADPIIEDYDCDFGCGQVQGTIAQDDSGDCQIDDGERPLGGWVVTATNGDNIYFGATNDLGEYAIELPPATYTISLSNPYDALWTSCVQDLIVTISEESSETLDIPMQATYDCPLLEVNLGTPFMRRCYDGFYYISYCNKGTTMAEDAYLEIAFDEYFEVSESTLPWSSVAGTTYTFDLGDIAPGDCGLFVVQGLISCESVLGQTLCSEATIYPNELCGDSSDSWDGASLELQTQCDGDSVRFVIRNVGEDMGQPVGLTIIEDDMIMMLEQSDVQLDADEEMEISLPANGSTWRLEAEQTPFHPYTTLVSKSIERCDEDGDGEFSLGFITLFPQYSNRPWMDELCVQNIGSFDPNDMLAWPVGAHEEHYIEPKTPLEYKIRFQNTGTDTAFLVVIQDTLPEWLDPSTLVVQSGSHDFEYKLSAENLLTFYFQDIMLPDSNINEEASHGFVKFRIEQAQEVPLGTVIRNEAAIYFDFNEPVITNQVFHTVAVNFLDIVNYVQTPQTPVHDLIVAPNPVADQATLMLKDIEVEHGTLLLYDLTGRLMSRQAFQGSTIPFAKNQMKAGLYLFEVWEGPQRLGAGKLIIR